MELIVFWLLEAVNKDARLAVYVATIITVPNHHVTDVMRPEKHNEKLHQNARNTNGETPLSY